MHIRSGCPQRDGSLAAATVRCSRRLVVMFQCGSKTVVVGMSNQRVTQALAGNGLQVYQAGGAQDWACGAQWCMQAGIEQAGEVQMRRHTGWGACSYCVALQETRAIAAGVEGGRGDSWPGGRFPSSCTGSQRMLACSGDCVVCCSVLLGAARCCSVRCSTRHQWRAAGDAARDTAKHASRRDSTGDEGRRRRSCGRCVRVADGLWRRDARQGLWLRGGQALGARALGGRGARVRGCVRAVGSGQWVVGRGPWACRRLCRGVHKSCAASGGGPRRCRDAAALASSPDACPDPVPDRRPACCCCAASPPCWKCAPSPS
jgi:hypothetical protein